MLLKNKAPSNKPKGEIQKSPKSSPKPLKKGILKKSNLLKNGIILNCKPVSGDIKISRKINKDNIDKLKIKPDNIAGKIVKKENDENETPEVANEIIFEVEKPRWDIINLSATDNVSEPGIYYKQEPLIKTFSDVISTSNRVDSVNSVSEQDSTTIKLNLVMKKNTKKRKSDKENAITTKTLTKTKAAEKVLSDTSHIHSINCVSEDDSSSIKLNLSVKKIRNKRKVDTDKSIKIRSDKSSKASTRVSHSVDSSPKSEVKSTALAIDKNEVKIIDNNNPSIHFSLGSIVWAKAPGFCWWPAIVDDDPDIKLFYWYEEINPNYITHYHVTFLDDDVSRCWVSPKNIKIFFPDPAMKSVNTKTCKKAHLKMMQRAIETAEKCLDLEPEVRLNKYSFNVRFTGKSNIWARADIKKVTRSPKNVDAFKSLALETSILETKSNILVSDSQQTEIVVSSTNSDKDKVKKRSKKMKNKSPAKTRKKIETTKDN